MGFLGFVLCWFFFLSNYVTASCFYMKLCQSFEYFSKILYGSFLANGVSGAFYFHENCFLLGTIAKCHLHGSDLLVQQHFRWVQLRWDGEPMHGLLQKFLRRKVINKVRIWIGFSKFVRYWVREICTMVMSKFEQVTKLFQEKKHSFLGKYKLCIYRCCAWPHIGRCIVMAD